MMIRYPESHAAIYEQLAKERGLSVSEFLVISVAERHNLTFASDEDKEHQLQLGA
jgi:hypothetical protein